LKNAKRDRKKKTTPLPEKIELEETPPTTREGKRQPNIDKPKRYLGASGRKGVKTTHFVVEKGGGNTGHRNCKAQPRKLPEGEKRGFKKTQWPSDPNVFEYRGYSHLEGKGTGRRKCSYNTYLIRNRRPKRKGWEAPNPLSTTVHRKENRQIKKERGLHGRGILGLRQRDRVKRRPSKPKKGEGRPPKLERLALNERSGEVER